MEETEGQKLLRKSRDNPSFPIGIAGFLGVLAYGAYKYKHRGTMSTSIFLIQLRVAAQGTVIGCLTLGMAFSLGQNILEAIENSKKKSV